MSSSSSAAAVAVSSAAAQQQQDAWIASLQAEWQADPLVAFSDGVVCAFDRWDTLQIAIDNQMAGNHTLDAVEEFIDDVIELFTDNNSKNIRVYADDIVDWLYDILSHVFHMDCQDGSIEHTAKLLCALYDDCVTSKKFDGLIHMLKHTTTAVLAKLQAQRQSSRVESDSGTDDDDEEGDDEEGDSSEEEGESNSSSSSSSAGMTMAQFSAQQQQQALANAPVVDEDGFETVQSKKKNEKKK